MKTYSKLAGVALLSSQLLSNNIAAQDAQSTADELRALRQKIEELEKKVKRSEEHTSELQSRLHLVCRLLLEKKKTKTILPTTRDSNHNIKCATHSRRPVYS